MHALSVRREEINIVVGKAASRRDKMSPRRTEGQNESASVWQGFCTIGRYTQTRQRRLRGKTVKTLVTAGTIKRPLSCSVERIGKQGIFHNVKEGAE